MSRKIKTVVVDDERLARKELISLLKEYKIIEVVAECSNAEEAKEVIEKKKPDLAFLDIQMPEKTGFDLLEELDYVPFIIFVTAYDEYALKAFEVNAFDYVLKPIEADRLKQAIEKISQAEEEIPQGQLDITDKVFLKDGEKTWFVNLSDIRYFESEGNYIKVHFENSKPLILRSLSNIELRLKEKQFFRTSRKHLVNLSWIKKVDNWFSGGLKFTLKTGEEIEVSRRQSQKFREMMSL